MVNNLLFLKLPEVIEDEVTTIGEADHFIPYNAEDFQDFDSHKIILPLVLVILQFLTLAYMCHRNVREMAELNPKMEPLDELNVSAAGNYGTFDDKNGDSSTS